MIMSENLLAVIYHTILRLCNDLPKCIIVTADEMYTMVVDYFLGE